jgi:predicted DNA-binding protein (MmcQ/YjbR family)
VTEAPIERVRRLCLSWPDATERLSHGEPTWFHRGKRSFATGADRHHDDRVAVWLASPPGARDELIEEEPERYFVPPYVGYRGWIGVYLDVDVDWERLEELIGNAYHTIAAPGR